MHKFKSEIEIQNYEEWLEDIEFEKIRDEEKRLLKYAKDKFNIILSNIAKSDANLFFDNEIKFGQFMFDYCISQFVGIRGEIKIKQQTAECAICLNEDNLISYLHLPPHQVFYYVFNQKYPVIRRLSEWDELQRLEDWIYDEMEDSVLNECKRALKREGKSDEFIDEFCKTYKENSK